MQIELITNKRSGKQSRARLTEADGKDKSTNHVEIAEKLIVAGLVFAAVFWIFQSIVDVVLFHKGNFIEQMLTPSLHEIWLRTLVICTLIMFGVCARCIVTEYKKAEEKIRQQAEKIRESSLNSITSLVYALEAKDKYTSGHSQRVTEMATAVARQLGMPHDEVERIRLAGLVHDIGKIGVRESILNKAGMLTEEEYRHIASHCEIGERILSPIMEDKEILDMVRHHHERYDGTGYPDGVSAEQIPQGASILAIAEACINISPDEASKTKLSRGARILAVADAYDAMTSDRPYRKAMSPQDAGAELEKGKGGQFDPVIVDAFLQVIGRDKSYKSPSRAFAVAR
jgi:putative nucleotidyltransferase with HDIG domain